MNDNSAQTGERTSALRAFWTLYRLGLRQGLAGKKKYAAVFVALIPTAIAVFWGTAFSDNEFEVEDVWMMFWRLGNWGILGTGLILVSLLMACSAFSDEVDSRTIFYLFSKPLPKWWIVIGKFLSSVTITFIVFAMSVCLTYAALAFLTPWVDVKANLDALAGFIVVALIGSIAYCAIFTFLGAVLRHPLLVSFSIAFIWEGVVANFPMRLEKVTVVNNLRAVLWGMFNGPHIRSVLDVDVELPSAASSLVRLGVCTAIFIVLAAIAVTHKSYEGREPTH